MLRRSTCSSHLKIRSPFALLLVFFWCLPSSATTVLVLVTHEGIVIAADSKVGIVDFGGFSAPPEPPVHKIFLVQDRVAVGIVGLGSQHITTADDIPLFDYDPAVWLKKIEQRAPPDISVTKLAQLMEEEGQRTFSQLTRLWQTEASRRTAPWCQIIGFQYLVSGFEAGVPVVEEVNFTIDKKTCEISAGILPVFPYPSARADFGFHVASMSFDNAIADDIEQRTNSPAYRSISSEASTELSMLLDRQDLSRDQAAKLLVALLRAQARLTPGFVGSPFTVLWLPNDGMPDWSSYN
jgi:hypothetical protein